MLKIDPGEEDHGCNSSSVARTLTHEYLLCFLFALLAVACDPGFRYRPVSMSKSGASSWSTQVDGVETRAAEYEDIDGINYFAPRIDVINRTNHRVVIENARLITSTGEHEVELPGQGELEWRSADPYSEASIPLSWTFDEAAVDSLGDRVRVTLSLQVGQAEHHLEIECARVEEIDRKSPRRGGLLVGGQSTRLRRGGSPDLRGFVLRLQSALRDPRRPRCGDRSLGGQPVRAEVASAGPAGRLEVLKRLIRERNNRGVAGAGGEEPRLTAARRAAGVTSLR